MTANPECPEPARLHDLLAGSLPSDTQAALAGHLDTCPDCQQALESLARGEGSVIVQGVKGAEGPPAVETALRQAMAELKQELSEVPTVAGPAAPGGASLPFLLPPGQPGHLGRLGSYEILEEIGRGGMGVVLKAFDPKLQRLVAVKVLAPHLAADDVARQRFLREARAAAAVRHEHVVTIYAVEDAGDVPYLVMEYVRGPSLQERLDRGPAPALDEIVQIGAQTAAGLAAAHAEGLVHRDVKPANILLEDGRRVKITDFGLARTVDEAHMAQVGPKPSGGVDTRLTQVGVVAGTPQYMAPEQARGQDLDHRADLFSLGSVLYALCAGRAPFHAETLVAVLSDVCELTPVALHRLNPAIPNWVAAVVEKLHAKDPAGRFQTAAEVAEVLNRHLTSMNLPPQLRKQFGFEYRSQRQLWGLPLVHVAKGVDPVTGKRRIARGWIAVGDVAVGGIAVGAFAVGGLAMGGSAVGLVAWGGLAIGLLLAVGGFAAGGIALGGMAVGGIALGGGAVGYYAYGGGAWGAHAVGQNGADPQAAEFFRRWLGLQVPGRPTP
jgi:serine/threonine-protein kinase